jgi:hypothetical protein
MLKAVTLRQISEYAESLYTDHLGECLVCPLWNAGLRSGDHNPGEVPKVRILNQTFVQIKLVLICILFTETYEPALRMLILIL